MRDERPLLDLPRGDSRRELSGVGEALLDARGNGGPGGQRIRATRRRGRRGPWLRRRPWATKTPSRRDRGRCRAARTSALASLSRCPPSRPGRPGPSQAHERPRRRPRVPRPLPASGAARVRDPASSAPRLRSNPARWRVRAPSRRARRHPAEAVSLPATDRRSHHSEPACPPPRARLARRPAAAPSSTCAPPTRAPIRRSRGAAWQTRPPAAPGGRGGSREAPRTGQWSAPGSGSASSAGPGLRSDWPFPRRTEQPPSRLSFSSAIVNRRVAARRAKVARLGSALSSSSCEPADRAPSSRAEGPPRPAVWPPSAAGWGAGGRTGDMSA